MSLAEGLRLGGEMIAGRAERERRAAEAEYIKTVRERERVTWAREDQMRDDSTTLMDEGITRAGQPRTDAQAQDYLQSVGLGRREVNPFAGANQYSASRARREGSEATMVADSQGGLAAPRALTSNPMRDNYVSQMKLGRAMYNPQSFLAAQGELLKADNGSQAASIARAVYDATPEQLNTFAQKYSDSANIPGSIKTDARTGLMTLQLEGGKPIVMDRSQSAAFVSGLWKLNNGDPSGQADLAAINKDLGAMADKQFGRLDSGARSNNDAVLKSNQMRNDNARTANDNARVGLARDRAALDKMGAAVPFQDKDGSIKMGIPTMGKGGLTYQIVDMPAGLTPYNSKGAGGEFTKVPGDGERVRDRQGNILTYIEGFPIAEGAVPPSQRGALLEKMSMPPYAADMIEWGAEGRFIKVQGAEGRFDTTSKKDMALVRKLVLAEGVRQVDGAEAQAAGQSIYDPRDRAAQGPRYQDRFTGVTELDRAQKRYQGQ